MPLTITVSACDLAGTAHSVQRPVVNDARLRIIVLGWVVRGPMGGLAWHYLQYALGLTRLGHDVWFVEDADDSVSCYDPRTQCKTTDPTFGLEFAADAFTAWGLGERWAHYHPPTGQWLRAGPRGRQEALRPARDPLNTSGDTSNMAAD